MSNQAALERFWVVIDEDGDPCYSAAWPGACHEHINDAINVHKLDEAAKWVVREAIVADHVKELVRLLRYAATHSSVAPLMNDSWREDSLAALEKLK